MPAPLVCPRLHGAGLQLLHEHVGGVVELWRVPNSLESITKLMLGRDLAMETQGWPQEADAELFSAMGSLLMSPLFKDQPLLVSQVRCLIVPSPPRQGLRPVWAARGGAGRRGGGFSVCLVCTGGTPCPCARAVVSRGGSCLPPQRSCGPC